MWTPGRTLEQIEKEAILKAYAHHRQNKTQTANSLGISIRTLDSKLEKYQQDDVENEQRIENAKKREDDFIKRSRGNVEAINAAANAPINFETKKTNGPIKNGDALETGVRVESVARASEKYEMPLSKQEEVQSLSSRHASASNTRKGR